MHLPAHLECLPRLPGSIAWMRFCLVSESCERQVRSSGASSALP